MPRGQGSVLIAVRQCALTLIAGLAHAASMGSPWDAQPVGWLQLLAMGVLVGQLDRCTSARQAAWTGWFFTTAWLYGTFWWLYISMHTYGGLNAVLTVLSIVSLAGLLAVYYAVACAIYVRLAPANKVFSALLFAGLWTMAEICRGTWFTGFGWGAAGYAHLDGLALLARFIGSYGVGAVAAFLAGFLALGLSRWLAASQKNRTQGTQGIKGADPTDGARRSLARYVIMPFVALLFLVAINNETVHGAFRQNYSEAAGALDVALLQGNIAQDEKFQPGTGIADSLRWYGEQIAASESALIVAPETAIPILPRQLPEGYWDALSIPFAAGKQALLVGIPLGSYTDGYTNSVIGVHAGPPYQYDKHHLVPFGEFIPPLFKWFTQMMNIPLGDFKRGAVGQASFEWQGQRLAPNICYEDLFGEELGARFADPATAPTIFVNVSNIGWFGNTVAIDQHLNISRMRAIEFERPFIRATNTGATVIIDHTGRVTHALPRHTRGVLLGQVQGRSGSAQNGWGMTPFARWVSQFGLWPYWVFGLGMVLVAALNKRYRVNRNAML